MRLLMVRHGESEGNAAGMVQGMLDMELTELGRLQAEQTAERLAELGTIRLLTSPLRRAVDTAQPIAEATGTELKTDRLLEEYDPGVISGLSYPELRQRFPQVAAGGVGAARKAQWPVIPGEEGRDVFLRRVQRALDTYRAEENETPLVLVTHGGFVNAACHLILGLDYVNRPQRFRVGNCSITEIARDRGGRWFLQRQNDVCHLATVTMANPG